MAKQHGPVLLVSDNDESVTFALKQILSDKHMRETLLKNLSEYVSLTEFKVMASELYSIYRRVFSQ